MHAAVSIEYRGRRIVAESRSATLVVERPAHAARARVGRRRYQRGLAIEPRNERLQLVDESVVAFQRRFLDSDLIMCMSALDNSMDWSTGFFTVMHCTL